MPLAIYAFSLCAFALGFTEFVVIGLVPAMSADLQVTTTQIGAAVTAYALGVSIGAPVLTAVTSGWGRKALLLTAMGVLIVGNLMVALAPHLALLLAARFASGLSHGVFLAVASSVAAGVAGPKKAGGAVALVFSGLTLALVLGVPAGTYLGSLFDWRAVFVFISVCAAVGVAGLIFGMPRNLTVAPAGRAKDNLLALFAPRLLVAALLSILAYGGAFAVFTYISPMLETVSGMGVSAISLLLVAYGVAAATGNILGGRLTDHLGVDKAVAMILIGLSAVLVGLWGMAANLIAASILVTLLGAFTFAAVPALQARIMGIAAEDASDRSAVAAGLNIAGFNIGIALGSFLGGLMVEAEGYAATSLAGAIVVALALPAILLRRREREIVSL